MPAVIPIATAAWGVYSAHKNASAQKKAANAQNSALQQQTTGLGQAQAAGRGLLGDAQPWTQQAGSYYQKLLSGNRGAMNQATAGSAAQISATYRGAEQGLNRAMIRGGAKDTAVAELNRDRAGALAGLTTGVQPGAAAALGQLGQQGTAMGLNGLIGASTGLEGASRQYGNQALNYGQNAREDMAGVGRSFGELLQMWQNRRNQGGEGGMNGFFGGGGMG